MKRLVIDVQAGDYCVVRLPAGSPVPAEVFAAPGLVSVSKTDDEVSVLCPQVSAPAAELVERDWRLLTARGPLEFTLTGIMAALSGALAAAGVPLFALSTYDTDHLLVKAADLDRAVAALQEAGHDVHGL